MLAIDPKEEYWPFKLLYKDHVNIVDLSPRGGIALNPFLFSDVEITAQSIAQNFLIIALNATGKEGRLLGFSSVRKVVPITSPRKTHAQFHSMSKRCL